MNPLATRIANAAIVASALTFVGAATAQAQTATLDKKISVTGAGSSFMSNFVEQCKADVKKGLGINITYQPSGSGAGRSGFIAGTTDFAGSDVPFSKAEAGKLKTPFVYIPIIAGGVAVMYKVPGVTDLQLSGPTLAKIFSGQIAKWNDAAIVKENPKAKLPKETIRVIVRSDSSGTSAVMSGYLDAAGGGNWKKGVTSTFPVPAGVGIAQKGSDGVANYVGGNQGNFSIGFAEVSFAKERKLPSVLIVNAAGKAVGPTAAAVSSALADAKTAADGTLTLNFATKKADAYPISTAAYIIAPTKLDAKKGDVLRAFLTHSLGGCQKSAEQLGYAPLPAALTASGLAAVANINPGSAASPVIK
jgi:phosphate transport system substrate-binding protein